MNARKHSGATALHSASRHLRADAARVLIRHGADETITTKKCGYGYTPLQVVGMRLAITSPIDIDIMRGLLIGAAEEASDDNSRLLDEANTTFQEEKERKDFFVSERIKRGLLDRPKLCSVLPIWKLAPCLLYYSSSVVGSVFQKEGHYFSSVSALVSEHFDLERVNRKGYKPSGFRSDGYQVQVIFMALQSQKPLVSGTKDLALGVQSSEH